VVSLLQSGTSLPILAQPNAGQPRLAGEQTIFDMSPQDFAVGMTQCLRAGALLLGGCCGASPAHIRALAEVIAQS